MSSSSFGFALASFHSLVSSSIPKRPQDRERSSLIQSGTVSQYQVMERARMILSLLLEMRLSSMSALTTQSTAVQERRIMIEDQHITSLKERQFELFKELIASVANEAVFCQIYYSLGKIRKMIEMMQFCHFLEQRGAKTPALASVAEKEFSHEWRGPAGLASGEATQIGSTLSRQNLPILIHGKQIKAQYDTGAELGNYMPSALASALDLKIRKVKSDRKCLALANGKIVRAIGRVKALCSFAKEPQTKVKCWFYVLEHLSAPLIMGSEFLERTQTLSKYTNRLESCSPCFSIAPVINLIGSTQRAKRRLIAFIDGRHTYVNADTGSSLGDLMSSAYVKVYGYKIDRRRKCRKRVQFADTTVAETIGQVNATLTMANGDSYRKTFDVLLGESTLSEINAFTVHESAFVYVVAGERHFELNILSYLGRVSEYLASLNPNARKPPDQRRTPSLAKRKDDAMLEALHAKDKEADRLRQQNASRLVVTPTPNLSQQNERDDRAMQASQRGEIELQSLLAPAIPPRSAMRGQAGPQRGSRQLDR